MTKPHQATLVSVYSSGAGATLGSCSTPHGNKVADDAEEQSRTTSATDRQAALAPAQGDSEIPAMFALPSHCPSLPRVARTRLPASHRPGQNRGSEPDAAGSRVAASLPAKGQSPALPSAPGESDYSHVFDGSVPPPGRV